MIQYEKENDVSVESSGALSEVYRRFTHALSAFSDFEGFRESLASAIEGDPYLSNELLLDCPNVDDADEALAVFEKGSVVVPLKGLSKANYIRVGGRRDEQPFGAQDIHLMGSIADMISILFIKSKEHQGLKEQAHVLQYLINQLPLGVVCFDGSGSLLIENKVAQRLLGEGGSALIEAQLTQVGKVCGERVRLHFEVDGKLIYSEGRSLEVAEGVVVDAYVLYDLSASREKLMKDLELEAYMSESRGGAVVVALLESRKIAGDIYKKVKASAADFDLEPAKIQPLDAYSCACVFRGRDLRSVRYLLKHRLPLQELKGLRLSVVAYDSSATSVAPAQELIDTAHAGLAQADAALLPELLVMDIYPPVVDALDLIVAGECRLRSAKTLNEADALIRSGQIDGLILDVDGYSQDVLTRMQEASAVAGSGFKVFYSSYKQPQMARAEHGLPEGACLLQKPFDAAVVVDAVALQFNLA